ncbi:MULTISPECIES: ATP-dependent Clp protease proteolytic subunit [unclassified Mesorhizobium]|uniref:ATP-dependent Clp protease proteolytic subunit n=1 Tax=unclassified Mesorhizobium TaxID=325217 RepID=UPI003336329B
MSNAVFLYAKGEVNSHMVEQVRSDLAHKPRATRLTLLIDSQGGDIDDAKRIYQAIRKHPAAIKRATIVNQCCSAGIIVLLACDYRRAQANAKIVLHPTEIEPAHFNQTGRGRWTAARYADAAARLQRIDGEILDLMAERTGASRASLASEDAHERETPLPKAIGLGLIHSATGFPSRCNASWPVAARAMSKSGALIGLPTHFFSEAFFAACNAAPRHESDE